MRAVFNFNGRNYQYPLTAKSRRWNQPVRECSIDENGCSDGRTYFREVHAPHYLRIGEQWFNGEGYSWRIYEICFVDQSMTVNQGGTDCDGRVEYTDEFEWNEELGYWERLEARSRCFDQFAQAMNY